MKRVRSSGEVTLPKRLNATQERYWNDHAEWAAYWHDMYERLHSADMRAKWSMVYTDNPLGVAVSDKAGADAPTRVALELKRQAVHRYRVVLVRCGAFYQAYGYDAMLYCDVAGFQLTKNGTELLAGQSKGSLQQVLDKFVQRNIEVAIVEQHATAQPKVFERRLEQVVTRHHPTYLSALDTDLLKDDDTDSTVPDPPLLIVRANAHNFAVISVYWLQRRAEIDHCAEEMLYDRVRSEPFVTPVHVIGTGKTSVQVLKRLRDVYGADAVLHHRRSAGEDSDRTCVDTVLQSFARYMGIDPTVPLTCDLVARQPLDACAPLTIGTASQFGLVPDMDCGVDRLVDFCLPPNDTRHLKRTLRAWLRRPPPRVVVRAIRHACTLLFSYADAVPQLHMPPKTLERYTVLLRRHAAHACDLRHVCMLARDVMELLRAPVHRALVDAMAPIVAHELCDDMAVNRDDSLAALVALERVTLAATAAPDDQVSVSKALPLAFVEKCESFRGLVAPNATHELAAALAILADAVQRLDHYVELHFGDKATLHLVGKQTNKQMCLRRADIAKSTDTVPTMRPGPAVGYVTNDDLAALVTRYEEAACAASACVTSALRTIADAVDVRAVRLAWHWASVFRTLDAHTVASRDRRWALSNEWADDTQPLRVAEAWPYWMERRDATVNSVSLRGVAIVTGANEGGKTTLLRTVGSCALLATCGLCVPAESVHVPPGLRRIYFRTITGDTAREALSGLAREAHDVAPVSHTDLTNSLVLCDELAHGTDEPHAFAITTAMINYCRTYPNVHVLLSTHLGRRLSLAPSLQCGNDVTWLRMQVHQRGRLVRYTHRVEHGVCTDSLGYASYEKAGCSAALLQHMAAALDEYATLSADGTFATVEPCTTERAHIRNSEHDVLSVFYGSIRNVAECDQCLVGERETAPALFTRRHVVYLRLDRKYLRWYVGETADIRRRISEHRETHKQHVFYIVAVDVTKVERVEDLPKAIEQRVIEQLGHHIVALDSIKDGANRIVHR